jgi:hypothetical protein
LYTFLSSPMPHAPPPHNHKFHGTVNITLISTLSEVIRLLCWTIWVQRINHVTTWLERQDLQSFMPKVE